MAAPNGPGYVSLTDLMVSRAQEYGDTICLGIPDKDLKITSYTFSQLELAVNLLATHYATIIPPRSKGDVTTKLTVALLAPSNYDYVVTELALSRLGYTVLFLSVNNSPAAIAHLCEQTGSTHLFRAGMYSRLAEDTLAFVSKGSHLPIIPLASPEVYGSDAMKRNPTCVFPRALTGAEEQSLVVFIVHSSGSTGFPKPIYCTHLALMYNIYVNFNLPGFTTMPIYHNGGHSVLYRCIFAVKPLWLFPASDLPITTANVLGILRQPEVRAEALFAVPYVYKLLGESADGVARLKDFKVCVYGGSAMPTELGDKLVSHGIKLVGLYGSTETGQLMTSWRDFETDTDWEYCRVSPLVAPFLRFEQRGPDAWEIVVLDGWKGKIVQNRPDGSYAVADLFTKHPTRRDLWRFVGRIDDTLVLVNGEKVNPVPIELTLKGESPYVQECIVFGAARALAGALVLLSEAAPATASREELLVLIAPALQLANAAAPSHSRISEELIIFLPYGTEIPRADKGSFIRRKVYIEFKDVIDGVYAALEGEGVDEETKKKVGETSEMVSYVANLIEEVAGSKEGLEPTTDLFTFGIDSLAAGRIRNSLQREFYLAGHKLSTNFVFEHPSIYEIASYLVAITSGMAIKELTPSQQMMALVEKYRHFDIPARHSSATYSDPSLAVIVLTGTTGSLGANLLAALLKDPSVKKVYNLVRARNDDDAADRVKKSMDEKGLPGGSDTRVVSLASDFSADRMGLTMERYNEIARDLTLVLHNAWSVNFNLGISSFEPHIRGACNLIKLCLDSDHLASFYFASSVSSVAAWKGPNDVPEAVPQDPDVAQGMGYARSKWVTERLCQIATETTPIRAVVLRIGQMVGSTSDGRWNETEAVSLMLKTGDTLGALPMLNETPSWLPVDSAANTIIDLVLSPPPPPHTSQVWHVMQPKTVPFANILDSLEKAGMKFERITPAQWVERLRTGPQDPVANPTIKLLEFFSTKYAVAADPTKAAKRYPLSFHKTLAASKSLREAPLVDANDGQLMKKFVESWRSTGFLQPSRP